MVELQYSGRASPSSMEEEEVLEREREAPRQRGAAAPLPSPLYRGPWGAPALGDWISQGGGEGGVVERGGGARRERGAAAPPPPPFYRGPWGAPARGDWTPRGGGGRPRAGVAPKPRWGAPPPLGFQP